MKTNILSTNPSTRTIHFLTCLLLADGLCPAQSPAPSAQKASDDYVITQIGPHSRVWANSAGQTVKEIETGMNYWDGNRWTPSNPSFVVSPDGTSFVASQIQDPTRIEANLNCIGAVTVNTPDNVTLRSTPVAIGLFDAASGQSVIVASLTNTTGVLVDPQHVVYDRAFVGGGFAASVVYSLPDRGSFHQDIVFTGFDKTFNPTNWGFAQNSIETLQIQIFTEFYDPPQPLMLTNLIYSEKDPNKRATMASPDLFDYTLDFGHYVFGKGRAFTTATNTLGSAGTRVAKDFVTSDGRTFLIETVPYRWLANQLQALPPAVTKTSSFTRPPSAKARKLAIAPLPSIRSTKSTSMQRIVPTKTSALIRSRPLGIDIDYVVTVSSTVEPTLYSSDTTYFVSGTVTESSTVIMESAVFKYPTNNIGVIDIEGSLTMSTTNFRPAIFTAADDNTAGTTLSTSIWSHYSGIVSSNYYGAAGIEMYTTANVTMNNVRFCYMSEAVELNAAPWYPVFTLSHAQLVNCSIGIEIIGSSDGSGDVANPLADPPGCCGAPNPLTLNLNNCLMGNVRYPFESSAAVALTNSDCNCTIDSCSDLFELSGSGDCTFINSIFSSVSSQGSLGSISLGGDYNGFYNNGAGVAFGGLQKSTSSNPYQSVGAGFYYLNNNSSFLTNGTTNVSPNLTNEAPGVFAALLSQLQMKTTQVPLILTNAFSSNTVLEPQAQRDTVGTALGWHYDPIDYITACSVSNATLTMTNGVALAYYDNLGVWLQDSSQLVSQGAPNYRNYIVYYGLVQEQPMNLWNTNTAVAQALPIAPLPYASSNKPSIFLRLTTISAPQGETNLLNTGDSNLVVSALTLRDCEVYGAGANWLMSESNNTPLVGLTNNVFHRVPFSISNSATTISYNNLFYGSTNTPGNVTNTTVSIRHRTGSASQNTNENNVFDGVTVLLDGLVGYNAYLHGGTNMDFTNNNDINTNLTWLQGPLGTYYQATNSPLLTNGSTSATNIGLYHYTVGTNEVVDGTNIVSRGYHYVALGTNGLPLDTSGDGVPDYLADVNGNNSGGTGGWTNYISPNGLTIPNGLLIFTPLH